jgi:phage shock protein PspC (stress-responsive transcriptional regulator)
MSQSQVANIAFGAAAHLGLSTAVAGGKFNATADKSYLSGLTAQEQEVLGSMTSEQVFVRAKARVLGGTPEVTAPALRAMNALRRSRDDRWLGGVCGGIARVTGVESWIWRLLFALLALCAGTGLLIYLLMWILIPAHPPLSGHAPGHPQAG